MLDFIDAGARNRTADLLITNQLLYQLSYTGFERQTAPIEATQPTMRAIKKCKKGEGIIKEHAAYCKSEGRRGTRGFSA